MKKNKWIIVISILVLIVGVIALKTTLKKELENQETSRQDYKNTSYKIDGRVVNLADKVKYFGNEVIHDLNDDGRDDVAFLITEEPGGSGVFYYIVAAINTQNGYVGSEAYFLGDRISPQSVHMEEGITSKGTMRKNVVVVNYADRLEKEPFTKAPSVGKSVWIKLDPNTMQFGEVAQNFEGETL